MNINKLNYKYEHMKICGMNPWKNTYEHMKLCKQASMHSKHMKVFIINTWKY